MHVQDAAQLKQAIEALIMLVRDEWPSDMTLDEIAEVGPCSDEQVDAIRRLLAGELPLHVSDQTFHVVEGR